MKPHALSSITPLLLLALAACNRHPADPAPPPTSSPQPTTPPSPPSPAPAPSPPRAAAAFAGRWSSASCGTRSYERWIDLSADGSVAGQDRISPCPENVACVWSGIVTWEGRWAAAGDRVTLAITVKGTGPAVTLPGELVWDANAKAPAEVHGEQRCIYRARE